MVSMMTRRRLEDGEYERWFARFDETAEARREAGCLGVRRFRGMDDPNEVFVVFVWKDLETARAFVGDKMSSNPQLSELRGNGAPRMENIFCEELPYLDY